VVLPDRIELSTSEWQAQEKARLKTALGRFCKSRFDSPLVVAYVLTLTEPWDEQFLVDVAALCMRSLFQLTSRSVAHNSRHGAVSGSPRGLRCGCPSLF
jgi:hypothetical protein